ncbi:hypothetical protein QF032_000044 [Streptomyces achromogenes]|nr:hypothetical protein [Streptomyces achromogenes]
MPPRPRSTEAGAVAVVPQHRGTNTEQRVELDVMHLRIYEVDVPIHDTNHPDRHGVTECASCPVSVQSGQLSAQR